MRRKVIWEIATLPISHIFYRNKCTSQFSMPWSSGSPHHHSLVLWDCTRSGMWGSGHWAWAARVALCMQSSRWPAAVLLSLLLSHVMTSSLHVGRQVAWVILPKPLQLMGLPTWQCWVMTSRFTGMLQWCYTLYLSLHLGLSHIGKSRRH